MSSPVNSFSDSESAASRMDSPRQRSSGPNTTTKKTSEQISRIRNHRSSSSQMESKIKKSKIKNPSTLTQAKEKIKEIRSLQRKERSHQRQAQHNLTGSTSDLEELEIELGEFSESKIAAHFHTNKKAIGTRELRWQTKIGKDTYEIKIDVPSYQTGSKLNKKVEDYVRSKLDKIVKRVIGEAKKRPATEKWDNFDVSFTDNGIVAGSHQSSPSIPINPIELVTDEDKKLSKEFSELIKNPARIQQDSSDSEVGESNPTRTVPDAQFVAVPGSHLPYKAHARGSNSCYLATAAWDLLDNPEIKNKINLFRQNDQNLLLQLRSLPEKKQENIEGTQGNQASVPYRASIFSLFTYLSSCMDIAEQKLIESSHSIDTFRSILNQLQPGRFPPGIQYDAQDVYRLVSDKILGEDEAPKIEETRQATDGSMSTTPQTTRTLHIELPPLAQAGQPISVQELIDQDTDHIFAANSQPLRRDSDPTVRIVSIKKEFTALPDQIDVEFKLFSVDGATKSKAKITVPASVEIPLKNPKKGTLYPSGLILHSGNTLNGGHFTYVAIRPNPTNANELTYYLFNDMGVKDAYNPSGHITSIKTLNQQEFEKELDNAQICKLRLLSPKKFAELSKKPTAASSRQISPPSETESDEMEGEATFSDSRAGQDLQYANSANVLSNNRGISPARSRQGAHNQNTYTSGRISTPSSGFSHELLQALSDIESEEEIEAATTALGSPDVSQNSTSAFITTSPVIGTPPSNSPPDSNQPAVLAQTAPSKWDWVPTLLRNSARYVYDSLPPIQRLWSRS